MNYKDTLSSLDLSPEEAEVYELVLISGQIKAGSIIKKSSLKRGNIYNILHKLVSRGLIEDFEINGVAHYRPLHPSAFINEIERKKDALERNKTRFETVLPDLVSEFNKSHHKPTIEYFEGESGIKKALEQMLNVTKNPIQVYIDLRSLEGWSEELDQWYRKRRKAKNIHSHVLYFDTEGVSDNLLGKGDLSEQRLLTIKPKGMISSVLEIFDEGVLYITLSNENKIATLIHDPRIAALHRELFNAHWDASESAESIPLPHFPFHQEDEQSF